MAGDQFLVVEDATQAREIAQRRERLDREAKSRRTAQAACVTLEDFMSQAAAGEMRTLPHPHQGRPGRSGGSARRRAGAAVERARCRSRSSTAASARSPRATSCSRKASGAIIIGFHVRPDNNARAAAEREGVDIKLYRIIYEAVDDVRAALEGMLRPEEREVMLGEAEVREIFKVPQHRARSPAARSAAASSTARRACASSATASRSTTGTIALARRFKDDVQRGAAKASSAASASRTSTTSRSAT